MPATPQRIRVRRGTAADWTASNRVLALGEPGYETDTGKLKFGDGITAWPLLAYFSDAGAAAALLTQVQAENSASTVSGLASGQRLAQAVAAHESGVTAAYASAAARVAETGYAITATDISKRRLFLQSDDGSLWLASGAPGAVVWTAAATASATLTQVQVENDASTVAGIVTGQRLAQAVAAHEDGITAIYASAAARVAETGHTVTTSDIAHLRLFLQSDNGTLWVPSGAPGTVTWVPASASANARTFASNTAVAPASAGAPTTTEIAAFAGTTRDTVILYTGTDISTDTPTYVFHIDAAGAVTVLKQPSSDDRIVEVITQAAHGFAPLAPVYHNGTAWALARADSANTVASGIVSAVVDANNFVLTMAGMIDLTAHGLTVGHWYWLSQATAGVMTSTQPSTGIAHSLAFVPTANTVLVKIGQAVQQGTGATLLSPDAQTGTSITDGLISWTVGGVPVGNVIVSGGVPKWTFDGIVDPAAYLGSPQTVAMRNALVATSPLAKAGYLVYVVDPAAGISGEYQVWSGTAWKPVASSPIGQKVTASATLDPGHYDLDTTAGAFTVTLADKPGTWNFYNTSQTLGTFSATVQADPAATFTDATGVQVNSPLIANVSGKPFTVLHPTIGTAYYVSVEQTPAAPKTFTPNGAWDASTNTPNMALAGNRVSGSTHWVYYISTTGTQDIGAGPQIYKAGGTLSWYSQAVFNYAPPALAAISADAGNSLQLGADGSAYVPMAIDGGSATSTFV
jgi:Major tropism determinant N-terminal domain